MHFAAAVHPQLMLEGGSDVASVQLLNCRAYDHCRVTMSNVAYAAFASVVALVPIIYIWSRYRSSAAARPSIKLEVFPAASPPPGPVVVVTGGSGFVGRRIIEMLLQEPQQYRVTVLDVLLPLVKHRSVTYVRGDICDPAHVQAAFKGADAVLHVASIIPSLKTQASPIIRRVNVDGTRVVIEACKVLPLVSLLMIV